MMKQHEQFTKYHLEDGFSRRYMEWLEHYKFGKNFKPINVDNLLSRENVNQGYADFWMKYWTAAYTHVLDCKTENVYLVDFDKLLKGKKDSLLAIAKCVVLDDKNQLVEASNRLRKPTSRPIEPNNCSPKVLQTANKLYERLKSSAIKWQPHSWESRKIVT